MSSLLPTSLARQGGLMASRSLPASVAVRRTLVLAQQMRQQQRFAATTSKVATTKLSHEDALKLLNEQRSLRPNSPHFTIYQPQLTWIASIFNRITGAGVSAREYFFSFVPLVLWPFCLIVFFHSFQFSGSALRLGGLLPGSSVHWCRTGS